MPLTLTPPHPLLACAATVRQAVKDASGSEPVFMTPATKQQALVELDAAVDQLRALRLRVLASADMSGDVAETMHSRDVAAWVATATHRDGAAVRREVRLARGLDDHPALRDAVADGRVNLDQAAVLLHALSELRRACPDLDPDLRTKALHYLIEAAAAFTPTQLRRLGRRILDVTDPETADDYERRRLEDEEAHAWRTCFLTTRTNGDGTTDLRARIPDQTATLLDAILGSFTNPRRDGDARIAPEDRRPYDQRLGHAFTAFVESTDPSRLPKHGGDITHVVVTIDHDVLTGRLEGLGLIGEEPITPGEVRRLACSAGILPAVLDGESQVLDLGRTRRLYTAAARRAHSLRHRTCQASGCDIPATWCDAHHRDPWSLGGLTDLDQLALLCSHHHHLCHRPDIATTYAADGTATFHRRTRGHDDRACRAPDRDATDQGAASGQLSSARVTSMPPRREADML